MLAFCGVCPILHQSIVMPEHNYPSRDSACGAGFRRPPSVSYYSRTLIQTQKQAFFAGSVRTVFHARSVEIPLPRSDRLAALPLPNPILRRAVRTLSRGFWLSVPDGSEWRELTGRHGKGAHRVPTRSAPFPWRLARIAEL